MFKQTANHGQYDTTFIDGDRVIHGDFTGCGEALKLYENGEVITSIPTASGDRTKKVTDETLDLLNTTMNAINKTAGRSMIA